MARKKQETALIRIKVKTRDRLRLDKRGGEKFDDDVVTRLLETQKKVDVMGYGVK